MPVGAWSHGHALGERSGISFGPEVDGHPGGDGGRDPQPPARPLVAVQVAAGGMPSARSRRSTGDSAAGDAATQYTPNRRSPCWGTRIGRGSTPAPTVDLLGAVVATGAAVAGVVAGTLGGADVAGTVSASDWSPQAATVTSRTSRTSSLVWRSAQRASRRSWFGHVMVALLPSPADPPAACEEALGAC